MGQLTGLGRLLIAVTFFTCGFFVNIAQLFLHICVKPFDKRLCRSLMYYLTYSFYSILVCVAEWYAGSHVRVFIDPEDEKKYFAKEHGLLLMNHTYEIDWLTAWMVTDKFGNVGNTKAYAKKMLRYVPIMGWVWWMAEFIFLDRNFDKDKIVIKEQLKVVFSYPDPVWLLLNAEGTRYTAAKHELSVKFAQERGLPVLKHHLIPRTKGFTTSLPTLRGICPAIYDINLAFKRDAKVKPTMLSQLNGETVEPYMYIRRVPLSNVPEDEKEAAAWMQEFFMEKDRIIDSFHETGSFFKTSGVKEVPMKIYKPRLATLLNFIGWATVCVACISYYMITSFIAGNWIGFFTVISILGLFYGLMQHAVNASKISKSSSYGADGAKQAAK
ncbi:1-acyl-sn-glycerol-3-phosphate acyltransferase gamma [Drosophila obscura]|uniref:1-acyl-sn-glycerol-3-phosphate acyltransferase gamma n=1 Tax=Drosophila obscura TaxID=7282 RepID=UPI000BA061F4|nr:1-acyl-sn-glycerol-3-phosphate acyltransferase gamma [Drosophila obscura]